MSLVIVTNRCFLMCERVVSIVLQERESEKVQYKRGSKWYFWQKEVAYNPINYVINVGYIPVTGNSPTARSNGYDEHNLELELFSKDEALKLFSAMVQEIRDQSPDEQFLDTLVAKILTDEKITR